MKLSKLESLLRENGVSENIIVRFFNKLHKIAISPKVNAINRKMVNQLVDIYGSIEKIPDWRFDLHGLGKKSDWTNKK